MTRLMIGINSRTGSGLMFGTARIPESQRGIVK